MSAKDKLQAKISFPAKKKSFRLSLKNVEKENLRCQNNKPRIDGQRSPLKNQQTNLSEDLCVSPKRSASFTGEASPPKQSCNFSSPSQLLDSVHIDTPYPKKCIDENTCSETINKKKSLSKKELFPPEGNSLVLARRALHSAVPSELPARQEKLEELTQIFIDRLSDCKPQALYISGPPGTGKTACLNSILCLPKIVEGYKAVYVNCTGLKSAGAIYFHICNHLNLKVTGRSEKAYQTAIQRYIISAKKMNLFVLDELDQLESKGQSVLYSIFEWGQSPGSKLVLVGIANSLDLTDRALPRLASRHLKPKLIHFAPYTREQIIEIITHRLKQVECTDVFEGGALHLLASKIATVSGDVRKALDIARRVIEIAQNQKEGKGKISVISVLNTVNRVYSTSESLVSSQDNTESFPLQQKLLICSLMLLRTKGKLKDVTVGKLHEVYKKVCGKRNLTFLDMSEFLSLIELIEVRGIVKLQGKMKNRISKVTLQWDEKEVSSALRDKDLLASILEDKSCL